jgi:hypothetical protein
MKTLMNILIVILLVMLTGCATGVSTYKYVHGEDGSTYVEVHSANEIEQMKMGINRETGTLEVEIGGMTKKSDTVEVMEIAKDMIHDVTNPGSGG